MSGIVDRARHMDRVLVCAGMLQQGINKGAIKKFAREKYGINNVQVNRYITRARKHLHAQANASRDEMRGASLGFYRAIARDPKTDTRDRLLAQSRIDKLLGLDAPMQTNQVVNSKVETKVVVSYEGDDWGRPAISQEQILDVAISVATAVNGN